MSLCVKIVNKSKNELINNKDNFFGILLDDNINEIKDKIFINNGIEYYNNWIKIEINIEFDEYILLNDLNNNLLYYYPERYSDDSILYITGIYEITDKDEIAFGEQIFNLEPYYLYNEIIKENSEILYKLFDELHKEFIDLTFDDLIILLKMKIIDYINENPIMKDVIGTSNYDYYTKDIEEYFINVDKENYNKKRKYANEKNLLDFYKNCYNLNDYSIYYDVDEYNFPVFNYTNITININTDVTGIINEKFIKLNHIFNTLELSQEIPFIVYNIGSRRTNPQIKIYNNIIRDVKENVIKSWVLNEKKKLNQLSYKKIKGLILKYKCDILNIQDSYLTVNINERGLIVVKLQLSENTHMIEEIKDAVIKSVNDIIIVLNNLSNIYLKSKKLKIINDINDSNININSISANISTNNYIIDIQYLREILNLEGISDIFELKDTKDDKRLSIYYKKFGKKNIDINEIRNVTYSAQYMQYAQFNVEKKGITINIEDNEYKKKSSIITIYGGYNLNQLKIIVNELILLSLKKILDIDDNKELSLKLKQKVGNTKKLRSTGVKVSSKDCQKQRQPKLYDGISPYSDEKSIIIYNNKKYLCPNKDYPYPGFTSSNILCCFKNENKGMSKNIKNVDILETQVEPSNFIIKIVNEETSFETFVIRVVSDITDISKIVDVQNSIKLDDDELSNSRYFYISNDINSKFPLVHIHNKELIKEIEEVEQGSPIGQTLWLKKVSLSQLIINPNKSKCNNVPELNNRSNLDINAPCLHHSSHKTLGYNIHSYPCCFENPRALYNTKKKKEKIDLNKHILKTDKLLEKQRLGELPDGLNDLFNTIIETDGKFYRWGVNQNQLSFFNCILEGIEYKTKNGIDIENTSELKALFINYLNSNKDEFNKLNSGNISLKYNTLKNYISAIRNNKDVINWNDIVDLVSRVIKCNILVLDIPYIETESTKTYDYTNTKLVCNLSIPQDITKPYMILIKKDISFEIIIKILDENDGKNPIVKFIFNYNENENSKTNIINFLTKYYSETCVKENEYPSNFSYDSLYTIQELMQLLVNSKHKVLLQLVNDFNKVNMIITRTGIIIPIKESGIINIPYALYNDFMEKDDKKLSISEFKRGIKEINKILPIDIKINGLTVEKDYYTGILTNFGVIIPVKKEEKSNEYKNLELPFKYYKDIDKYLSNKITLKNESEKWNDNINEMKNEILDIKKVLFKQISELSDDFKNNIKILIKDRIERSDKIDKLIGIFKDNLREEYHNEFILKHIANEVINDNIENLFLDNIIESDELNSNEIIKNDNESILLNIPDIKKWIKKYS